MKRTALLAALAALAVFALVLGTALAQTPVTTPMAATPSPTAMVAATPSPTAMVAATPAATPMVAATPPAAATPRVAATPTAPATPQALPRTGEGPDGAATFALALAAAGLLVLSGGLLLGRVSR